MDYQIVPKSHKQQYFMFVISLLAISLLPLGLCIVNRDLVLTPKQGLQLSGKRIFYEENLSAENKPLHHNDTAVVTDARPWERALKHVTYLTLFTNAANGIITGNYSKVKEYNDFLTSAYIPSSKPIDSRFGDIVTLADGRLESMANGSYHFVEGNCDYECARESNIIAMWHVQKIRHRDTADRKYHYEMKFSVSPMTDKAPTETLVRGGPNKRTIMKERKNNHVQTFIQKEDDYPNSFGKIVTDKDEDFLAKRYEVARNFRQVSAAAAHQQRPQVTPIPQSTFLRNIYHQAPPLNHASMQLHHHHNGPPQQHHSTHTHSQLYNLMQQQQQQHRQQLNVPERLNIGEFYKGNYAPKTTSKIELFPNLLNIFMGKTPQQHTLQPPPTTFRPPIYQMKFPRPDIFTLQQHQTQQEFPKFSEYQQQQPPLPQSQEQFNQRTSSPAAPIVTHHYHHHYFMPNNSAITIEQAAIQHGVENTENAVGELYYNNEVTEVATPQGYVTGYYDEPQSTTTLRQQHFPQIQQQQHQIQTQYLPNIERQNFQQNYHSNYQQIQHLVPPAPQKFVFPITQIEQQRVVHVTPAPPLRKPQYAKQQQLQEQGQQPQQSQHYENRPFPSSIEYTTVHVPLLISYPASINEEKRADVPTPRNRPFVQSEPLEDSIHYSEPDPLYANVNQGERDNQNKFITDQQQKEQNENQEPQLESPDHYDQSQNNQQQNLPEADNRKEHSESIEAQLPAPKNDNTLHDIGEQNASQTSTSTKSVKTEPPTISNSITTATKRPQKIYASRNKRISIKTGTTTSSTSTTTTKPTTTSPPSSPKSSTTESLKSLTNSRPKKNFVSLSSTESHLKAIGRYRNSYTRPSATSTTTTEKPVLKWTPKRKNNIDKFSAIKGTTPPLENQNPDEEQQLDGSNENDDDKDDNDENEDFKTNESNNLPNAKSSMLTTTPETFVLETTTDISNDITTRSISTKAILSASLSPSSQTLFPTLSQSKSQSHSLSPSPYPSLSTSPSASPSSSLSSSPSSSLSPSPSLSLSPSPSLPPLLLTNTSQAETEIYEVLTQKSVSKSVSLKVGNNGEEIPVIIDDEENEVKKF